MNRKSVAGMLCILLMLSGRMSMAQTLEPVDIPSYCIYIGGRHTTNLIFPQAIVSVDRGSGSVIVQKARGVDNILQAKSAGGAFDPTNLSVVTADGRFYSFEVFYNGASPDLTVSFAADDRTILAGRISSERDLARESGKVAGMARFARAQRKRQDLRLRLEGIWLSKSVMWYRFELANTSEVTFRAGYLRFFLRDKKRLKRTAVQETEVFPVFREWVEKVDGRSRSQAVFGFEPFTIPADKILMVQVGEAGSGRMVSLPLRGKTVLKARRLPD